MPFRATPKVRGKPASEKVLAELQRLLSSRRHDWLRPQRPRMHGTRHNTALIAKQGPFSLGPDCTLPLWPDPSSTISSYPCGTKQPGKSNEEESASHLRSPWERLRGHLSAPHCCEGRLLATKACSEVKPASSSAWRLGTRAILVQEVSCRDCWER